MAKKQQRDTTRQKAADMRAKQKRKDARTKGLLIALVSILVFAIVIAIVFMFMNRPNADTGPSSLPEPFQTGAPIVVSSAGVMGEEAGPDALTLYYDYSCGACATTEDALSPDLMDGAINGDYTLALQPVITAGMAYNEPATAAAITVASQAPEYFIPLHEAMLNYLLTQLQADQGGVVQDVASSLTQIQAMARDVGVPEDVVTAINPAMGATYLQQSTPPWIAANIEGRENPATPEFVFQNTHLTLSGDSEEALYASLLDQMNALK